MRSSFLYHIYCPSMTLQIFNSSNQLCVVALHDLLEGHIGLVLNIRCQDIRGVCVYFNVGLNLIFADKVPFGCEPLGRT